MSLVILESLPKSRLKLNLNSDSLNSASSAA